MIQISSIFDGHRLTFDLSVSQPVYLDNWAIYDLAEGDSSRRERFVNAVRNGADLLFSFANVVQLTGPKGESFGAVKSFLDELGPHWVPIEIDLSKVVEREQNGVGPDKSYISAGLMDAYVQNRIACWSRGSETIIYPGPDFFRLGAVLDWVAESQTLPKQSTQFDDLLREIPALWPKYKENPSVLDQQFRTFNPSQPATFVWGALSKTLIIESKSHKVQKGDGMDFCHAVMGSAFAKFATLDTPWKRRVEALPKPNRLARIYGPKELDQMVTDIERAQRENSPANTIADGGADEDRTATREPGLVVLPGSGLLVPSSLLR